ncbi:MAG: hypothetical protein C0434_02025 [Xanthomonadaceae bacterium]|nr:hypothetical protein [Xanthomonadaceae bacterium]
MTRERLEIARAIVMVLASTSMVAAVAAADGNAATPSPAESAVALPIEHLVRLPAFRSRALLAVRSVTIARPVTTARLSSMPAGRSAEPRAVELGTVVSP